MVGTSKAGKELWKEIKLKKLSSIANYLQKRVYDDALCVCDESELNFMFYLICSYNTIYAV